MDEKTLNRTVNFEHLKPLSVYSRSFICDAEASLQFQDNFSRPFINFKVEIANICLKKRKRDDSLCDDGYWTPPKQLVSPAAGSPDLGCVVDYSPTGRQGCVCYFPSLLEDTQDIKSESERGDVVVEVGPEEQTKERHLDADKGNLFVSYKKDIKTEQITPDHAAQPTATSTPRHVTGNAKKKSLVESSSQHTTTTREPAALPSSRHRSKRVPPRSDGRSVSRSEKCVRSGKSKRTMYNAFRKSVISNDESDWEIEKRCYVHLVTRHLNENSEDVMTELQNLMTSVADQTPGSNSRQWQHPSDFTCRNYQQQFGNTTAKMTLDEWQAKHHKTFKRFAKVSKMFRSLFS